MKRDPTPADTMPMQTISRDVLQEKYLKPGEADVEDLYARVANALVPLGIGGHDSTMTLPDIAS